MEVEPEPVVEDVSSDNDDGPDCQAAHDAQNALCADMEEGEVKDACVTQSQEQLAACM